jgi:hypothetical protein
MLVVTVDTAPLSALLIRVFVLLCLPVYHRIAGRDNNAEGVCEFQPEGWRKPEIEPGLKANAESVCKIGKLRFANAFSVGDEIRAVIPG